MKALYYALLAIVSVVFALAGVSKLLSVDSAVQSFAVASLPLWLMYVVGAIEVLGTVGIWITASRKWSAAALYVVLIGATIVTAAYVSVPGALFPILVGAALYFALWISNRISHSPAKPSAATPAGA